MDLHAFARDVSITGISRTVHFSKLLCIKFYLYSLQTSQYQIFRNCSHWTKRFSSLIPSLFLVVNSDTRNLQVNYLHICINA